VVEAHLRSVLVIAGATIGFALLLAFADTRRGALAAPGWREALIIGAMQTLALIPGTSRSGITITAALLLGISRTGAARFSFLLSIPTIGGAGMLATIDLIEHGDAVPWGELAAGALLSGIAAFLCIRAFIALVERTGMLPYVAYRLVLGIVLLGVFFVV
jgi:undecaprenyl-diphosphatase